jgi:hypothetical protein
MNIKDRINYLLNKYEQPRRFAKQTFIDDYYSVANQLIS